MGGWTKVILGKNMPNLKEICLLAGGFSNLKEVKLECEDDFAKLKDLKLHIVGCFSFENAEKFFTNFRTIKSFATRRNFFIEHCTTISRICPNVEKLNIGRSIVTEEIPVEFNDFHELKSLSFTHRIYKVDFRILKKLEYFSAEWCEIESSFSFLDKNVIKVFRLGKDVKLTKENFIRIYYNRLTKIETLMIPGRKIDQILILPKLREIEFYYCPSFEFKNLPKIREIAVTVKDMEDFKNLMKDEYFRKKVQKLRISLEEGCNCKFLSFQGLNSLEDIVLEQSKNVLIETLSFLKNESLRNIYIQNEVNILELEKNPYLQSVKIIPGVWESTEIKEFEKDSKQTIDIGKTLDGVELRFRKWKI